MENRNTAEMCNEKKRNKIMRKIIVGIPGCSKCKRLKELNPDAEYVEVNPQAIIPLARELQFAEMPFVVLTGSVDELAEEIK